MPWNENECKENENSGSEQKRSDTQNHASLAESLPAYQDLSGDNIRQPV